MTPQNTALWASVFAASVARTARIDRFIAEHDGAVFLAPLTGFDARYQALATLDPAGSGRWRLTRFEGTEPIGDSGPYSSWRAMLADYGRELDLDRATFNP